jgi:dipeptidyl aminopeptidase/acylaminoacyl peptidase
MSFDPISEDPEVNSEYPSKLTNLYINSEGSKLLGRFFLTHGEGLHPTILLLHGMPGIEINIDLARILCRAGWNVLVFHYRGAWGSEGEFSLTNSLEDVENVIKYLTDEENAKEYNIDTEKIVIIGHSLGGFMGLITATKNSTIKSVASIAGPNVYMYLKLAKEKEPEIEEDEYLPLKGVTIEKLMTELVEKAEEYNLLNYAEKLAKKKVLIVAGTKDDAVPMEVHHKPVVEAIKTKKPKTLTEKVLEGDHAFSDKRVAF